MLKSCASKSAGVCVTNGKHASQVNISGWESDDDDDDGETCIENEKSTTTEMRNLLDNFPHTKQVGAYLIGRTIGEGSFAKVKEGLHVLTGEKVTFYA
jgi:hypothetical protein